MSSILGDLRHAARTLRKNPGLTVVVTLTLGLGIGVNTALYSVGRAVLKPLPGVAHYEQLASLQGVNTAKEGGGYGLIAYADYFEYRQARDVLSGLAAAKLVLVKLVRNDGAHLVPVEIVSGSFFDVLGVRPVLGRAFRESETETFDGPPVAVLSYGSWQDRFGGAPDVVGQTVTLNGRSFTIVGVAPRGFMGTARAVPQELWVPTAAYDQLFPNDAGALRQR